MMATVITGYANPNGSGEGNWSVRDDSLSVATCSNCGRQVRLIDTVSYVGADTHQLYRVCIECQAARKRHL